MTDTQRKNFMAFKLKHLGEIYNLNTLLNNLNESLPYLDNNKGFKLHVVFDNDDKVKDLIIIYPNYVNFNYPNTVRCFKEFVDAVNALRAKL